MCPIHDTDSPEERWSKAEWDHYELWEKREAREKRKRRWVLAAGFVVFLILSAVPIVRDRSPQWLALKATRELAEHLGRLRREAGVRGLALRVKVDPSQVLSLQVERASDCKSTHFEPDQSIRLLEKDSRRELLAWLDPQKGQELKIPGLLTEFCYDPLQGSSATPGDQSVAGFVILPVNDLTPERLAVLLLKGPSAEISFE